MVSIAVRSLVSIGIASIAAGCVAWAAQSTGIGVLGPDDVRFEGYRNVQTNGAGTTWGKALTHRYVDGDLRFLTIAHPHYLHEYSLRGIPIGGTVSAPTNHWELPEWMVADYTGIWWEQERSRLWLVGSVDYGEAGVFYPSAIHTMTLGPNSQVSNVKTVSLGGISSKLVFGGVQPVPAWAQKALGCGPYAVGWGGYTSLMHERSRSSLGPVFVCMPSPDGFAHEATIPRRMLKILLDAEDSRGVRRSIATNYFDGGDPRQNPSSRPTGRPAPGARWQNPTSDGLGWFLWGDSYFNTGMWIEGPEKRGWVAIASLGAGACWYAHSSIQCDGLQYEMHIWDPARLNRGPQTKPDSMTELDLPRQHTRFSQDYGVGRITGATWDPVTGRMYLQGFPLGPDNRTGRLYSYVVHTGTAGQGR